MSSEVDDPDEVLRRQIVSQWIDQTGNPMSVAFAPTTKDQRLLSTDRGSVPAQATYEGYVLRTGRRPHSTWPMVVGLVTSAHERISGQTFEPLKVVDDGGENGLHDGHASIIFPEQPSPSAERRTYERIRKLFRDDAVARGALYIP